MSDFDDYPFAPVVAALRTVFGRLVLILCSGLLGVAIGGVTATGEAAGAWHALARFPEWAVSSLFFSVGLIAFPLALLFAILFVRSEWPLPTSLVAVPLLWWNAHTTLHWVLYESRGAELQRRSNEMMKEIGEALKAPGPENGMALPPPD